MALDISFKNNNSGQLKNLFLVKLLEKHLICKTAIVKKQWNKFNNHILHLSLSLSLFLSLSFSFSLSFSLFLSPSLYLTLYLTHSISLSLIGKEGVRTPGLGVPHSVSQSACVIMILMLSILDTLAYNSDVDIKACKVL